MMTEKGGHSRGSVKVVKVKPDFEILVGYDVLINNIIEFIMVNQPVRIQQICRQFKIGHKAARTQMEKLVNDGIIRREMKMIRIAGTPCVRHTWLYYTAKKKKN